MGKGKLSELRALAMSLPLRSGVYLMKNAQGVVIYVGKAKALKNRVSQYFGSGNAHGEKVRRMVENVDHFDYILTDSEHEALVLECSLIKQYSPRYNVLLKDDKGYHYIRISPPPFSHVSIARRVDDDGSRYLGPYVSSFAVTEAVDEVNSAFQLPGCTRIFREGRKDRPCLNFHIGKCCAPCAGRISKDAYNERVEQATEFLVHGGEHMQKILRGRMEEAAENLEFEKAARFRDRITALSRLSGTQKVVMSRVAEQDIIALAQGGGSVAFEVFRFTAGRLSDREDYVVSLSEAVDADAGADGAGLPAARSTFLRRYYSMRGRVPPQITVDGETEDAALLEQWLGEKAGRRVHIVQPQKGEQAKLVEMCRDNAAERLAKVIGSTGREAGALDELSRLLGMEQPPSYIESYDISNTAGADPVAGMVVFENGRPLKSAYRRFMVKTTDGYDDYAAMREIVTRRFEEYKKHRERGDDTGFGRLPDLILLDGGQGHVSVIRPVVKAMGFDIPIYGMVKDDKHRTRAIAENGGEIAINSRRSAFTLVSSIQEEVHRWAITYHRQKRRQSGIGTVLTEIDGVGESRARALLRHFGSIKAIREASTEELAAVKGVSKPAAEKIKKFFEDAE